MRLEREKVSARVVRVYLAQQEAFGLDRGDAVAQVAASSGEGLGQLLGFNGTRRLKEQRRQHQGFKEAEFVGG